MLFLVVNFIVKIHIISILYVTLPSKIKFKSNVFGTAFCEKAVKY
jgi:hypothetical protein